MPFLHCDSWAWSSFIWISPWMQLTLLHVEKSDSKNENWLMLFFFVWMDFFWHIFVEFSDFCSDSTLEICFKYVCQKMEEILYLWCVFSNQWYLLLFFLLNMIKILIIKHSKFKWKLASNYLCTCLHKIMYEWIKCQKGNSYSGLCV